MTVKYKVGTDIGGTFTDIVFIGDDGSFFTHKSLSTPDDYSRGIITGMQEVIGRNGIEASDIERVVHGCTIVTNACIELTGAKIGLITTKGFRDILEITRGRMPVMYDLLWSRPVPLVPRHLRVEVDERINAKGDVIKSIDIDDIKSAIDKLLSNNVEGIAVCLFNSPKNPVHEKKIGHFIEERAKGICFSLSVDVMPVLKEYERTSETVVNVYVMPLVKKYLQSLRDALKKAGVSSQLYMMQSNGGMITPEIAATRPIEIIECGPAAGVVGAAFLGKMRNLGNVITFDMGGTTTKASIVEKGEFTRSPEYEIGGGIHRSSRLLKGKGYVVRIPSIDIAEIGNGGGSIIKIDKGAVPRIGPQSAGAVPGPVCYDRGGMDPTLTDICVILGYLNPRYLVGGELKINAEKAYQVIKERVAKPLKMDVLEAAYGVYTIANSEMLRAIRAVSSERGRDPRKFVLFAFGGAGPVHAAGVAKGLNMEKIIIPPSPGVFSAFGLMCSDIERHYVRAFYERWDESVVEKLNHTFHLMTDEAISSVGSWAGLAEVTPHIERFIDLRYAGQTSELTIPVGVGELNQKQIKSLSDTFAVEHEKTYGHRLPGYQIQIVNLRITALIPAGLNDIPRNISQIRISNDDIRRDTVKMRKAYWGKEYGLVDTQVLDLEDIGKSPTKGPILVDCYDTTIVVPPDCAISTSMGGNIIIDFQDRED